MICITRLRIIWLLLVLSDLWQAAHCAELIVRIENPPSTGMVSFVLFDSADAFGKLRDPAQVVRFPLDGRASYRIENVLPGEYALLLHYDENENLRIDRNFIGIPKEPLGFSNDYRPKGPPNYRRAAFVLQEGEPRHFDVVLARPLGDRGRLGAGVGFIARSSPYRDYRGNVSQVIPAVTYNGNRVQILGPSVQIGLIGSDRLRFAARGEYRIGVYEEEDSEFLKGMGDAEDTFMAGLAVEAELEGGVDFSLSYKHDVLNRIGGGTAGLDVGRPFQVRSFRLSPAIGLNWLGSELSNHDFGVPQSKATADRPAYRLDHTWSVEAGFGVLVEIRSDCFAIMRASMEWLEEDVRESPLVQDHYVIKGFGAVQYVF